MQKQKLKINDIPAVIWGRESDKVFIAVHGNLSHKEDTVIQILAEEAEAKGYQVLSFDLQGHGDRKEEGAICRVESCMEDLKGIMQEARLRWQQISLMACSMGAYFSLLTYKEESLKQAIFLSPVVNMKRIIEWLMQASGVTEERLKVEKTIGTDFGQTLYWDYYSYVKAHPIIKWNTPTHILYGEQDQMCEKKIVQQFAQAFECDMVTLSEGEHYFHTEDQLSFYRKWLRDNIL